MQNDPRRLPALDRLVVFDAAARHLSFTKAAAERFLTQSAVSRQIAALEEELGAPLFRRRHRALELTDDGRLLAEAVKSALGHVREAVVAIRAPRQREVLALTTTPGLASLWLIPRLARLVAAHPGIDVRIDATHDKRNLAGDGFDLAIRYAALGSDGEPLFEESVQPVCAPQLRRARHPLRRLDDLRHHTLLQVAVPHVSASGIPLDWQAWLQAVGAASVEPAATLTFTNYDTAVAAAVEGQGLVLGRRPLVDRLLAQGKLVAPFKGQVASARGYYIVVEAKSQAKPAVRALVAWLHEQARGD
jgi:DNA-binding transcriptional LysR family regulator